VPVAAVLPGTGGLIVGGLAAVVAISIVLWIPVLGDRLTALYAPKTFLVGLGFLLTGIVAHVEVLVLTGASVIGLLALALIYDNY
jgi:hypothetical protein